MALDKLPPPVIPRTFYAAGLSYLAHMFGCDGPTEPALNDGDLVEVVNEAIGVLASRVRKET